MDVDPPTNEPIDVDEDGSQTGDENKVRHLRVLLGGRVIVAVLVAVRAPSSIL